MTKWWLIVCVLITNMAHGEMLEGVAQQPGDYSEQVEGGVRYGIYHARAANVSLHWKNPQGKAYGGLRALKRALIASGQEPVLLMNAGIYTKDYAPAGLWIENGNTLSKLNTNTGHGNFHLEPNGVFLLHNNQAQIVSTESFAQIQFQPDYAVQSGPMLLIDGQINARFLPKIDSSYKRNAVCITKDAQLYFILTIDHTSSWPNFYHFSQALQSFGCQQALYLDGAISDWYIKGITNTFHWSTFVGIIAVTSN